MCKQRVGNSVASWPRVQWLHVTDDIWFLYEHEKLELLTIAVAAYFEGTFHAFLFDAMLHIHRPTRTPAPGTFSALTDELAKHQAEIANFDTRMQKCDCLFKKYRSVSSRMKKLCKTLFGSTLDELVRQYYPGAEDFLTNRRNIHEWRNLILHRGVPLNEVWSPEMRTAAPQIAIAFVKECWDVFRVLSNKLIHEPSWSTRSAHSGP